MITPMLRPDLFGGLATHAGDGLYECCYVPEFAKAVRFLRAYDGDIFAWWEEFQSRTAFTKEGDTVLVMTLGVAACFSARDDGTPELPFDPQSGRLRDEIWAKWLAWDPGAHGAEVRRRVALACARYGSTRGHAMTGISTSRRPASATSSRRSA